MPQWNNVFRQFVYWKQCKDIPDLTSFLTKSGSFRNACIFFHDGKYVVKDMMKARFNSIIRNQKLLKK